MSASALGWRWVAGFLRSCPREKQPVPAPEAGADRRPNPRVLGFGFWCPIVLLSGSSAPPHHEAEFTF